MFAAIRTAFLWLINFLSPPQAFSWQTLFLLSLFSYIMAALASPAVRELLAMCGWIFLIAGVEWLTREHPVKVFNFNIGPWITGALVTLLLLGSFLDEVPSVPVVSWPIISALIASGPKFLNAEFKFSIPGPKDRQYLVILILTNVLLSCWLQFYFTTQEWSREYAGLMSNSNVSSNRPSINPDQGQLLLQSAESLTKAQVQDQPWPQVERWLFDIKNNPDQFNQSVILTAQQNSPLGELAIEPQLWRVVPQIRPGNPYQLEVLALWQGSTPERYYLRQVCDITEAQPFFRPSIPFLQNRTPSASSSSRGRVNCTPISELIRGQPANLERPVF